MADRVITKINAAPKFLTFQAVTKCEKNVAAYARVSTDHEDQQTSLAAQVDYYKKKIKEHPGWTFVKVYADEGISGLSTIRRESFLQMIADCEAGAIDLILTKSISRFARNTVDTITTIRMLKSKGIGVYFEKENIFSLDSKGEFLLTIMSSLAQEESRSISENVCWGQRKRMADGKSSLAYSRFLGYDKGANKYEMVVNEEQAAVVRRLFFLFIQGYTPHTIAQILTAEGIKTPVGCDVWNQQTVRRILSNEKYKGDALLQKEFTINYLEKKTKKNEGELPQYYIEGDHEAIIAPWFFDYVQELLKKRKDVVNGRYSGVSCLSSKIIGGKCGATFGPRPWHSTSYNHRVWQCHNRSKKPVLCKTHNLYESLLFYLLHDTARALVKKRRVMSDVLEIVSSVTGDVKPLQKWTRDFRKKSAWELLLDEEDIALVINEILVTADGKLSITLIDGKKAECVIPRYRPSKGIQTETADIDSGNTSEPFDSEISQCRNCGKTIKQTPKQKKRIFCCSRCKALWNREHSEDRGGKAVRTFICQHCGKEFTVYNPSKERKYCSNECYIAERFGK